MPTRNRGSWIAWHNGVAFPVVHSTFVNFNVVPFTYREGNGSPWDGRPEAPKEKWAAHLDLIQMTKAVFVQIDTSETDPNSIGYIGGSRATPWPINNIKVKGDVISFKFVGRR